MYYTWCTTQQIQELTIFAAKAIEHLSEKSEHIALYLLVYW